MIRPIAFCAGLALAWCGTAEAACISGPMGGCIDAPKEMSMPSDATKIEIDDLKARVKALEQIAGELCQELAMPCPGKPQ